MLYRYHSQAKLVKLVHQPTLFRLLGKIVIFVIVELPATELDLKWKSHFKAVEFWVKFQLWYRRPSGPKASPPVK